MPFKEHIKNQLYKFPNFRRWLKKLSGAEAQNHREFITQLQRAQQFRKDIDASYSREGHVPSDKVPSLQSPIWQICTTDQFMESEYERLTDKMNFDAVHHRKVWEYAYILKILEIKNLLQPGKKGIGFGVGRDPMVALMAKKGCNILCTDLAEEAAAQAGWVNTKQYSVKIEQLNERGLCSMEQLKKNVTLQNVDMNQIPKELLNQSFDFVWSACAFEHLGSLEAGLQFVEKSLQCLKPGGIFIHTTEYNITSNTDTLEQGSTVIYRKSDIQRLYKKLESLDINLPEMTFNAGNNDLDYYPDLPPYSETTHIKLKLDKYTTSSIGIWGEKI